MCLLTNLLLLLLLVLLINNYVRTVVSKVQYSTVNKQWSSTYCMYVQQLYLQSVSRARQTKHKARTTTPNIIKHKNAITVTTTDRIELVD